MTSADPPASRTTLAGLRLLVVDDEPLVAMLTEEILLDAQALHVATANNEPSARAVLDQPGAIDAGVIDVNLWGESSFGIALALQKRRIPFVFATGYGDQARVPDAFKSVPIVTKPFLPGDLIAGLLKALSAVGDGPSS